MFQKEEIIKLESSREVFNKNECEEIISYHLTENCKLKEKNELFYNFYKHKIRDWEIFKFNSILSNYNQHIDKNKLNLLNKIVEKIKEDVSKNENEENEINNKYENNLLIILCIDNEYLKLNHDKNMFESNIFNTFITNLINYLRG